MPKKLTYEFIKSEFDKEGCTLLSTGYKNSSTKLECICPKGHKYKINWNNWQQGGRCNICAINKRSKNQTLNYDHVKSQFEKEGFVLLSKEYVNAKNKLECICPNGHTQQVTWMSWRINKGCRQCAVEGLKNDFEFIKTSFEKENYTLLSTEYINAATKLDFICPNGHRHSINWNSWLRGHRCGKCIPNSIDDIKIDFENNGYTLLSEEYKNTKTKLEYKCPNGHQHSITYGNWKSGKRCPYCAGSAKKNIKEVKDIIESEGYTLLSKTYKNAHVKLKISCPKGHVYKTSWHNWDSGKRCPICPAQQSKFEKEVRLFLDGLSYSYITNDRTQIKNPFTNRWLELDIYLPDINKAIECNGDYWHSNYVVSYRDTIKKKQCDNAGIDLLVVTDTDWYTDSSTVKTTITNFIGACYGK